MISMLPASSNTWYHCANARHFADMGNNKKDTKLPMQKTTQLLLKETGSPNPTADKLLPFAMARLQQPACT